MVYPYLSWACCVTLGVETNFLNCQHLGQASVDPQSSGTCNRCLKLVTEMLQMAFHVVVVEAWEK